MGTLVCRTMEGRGSAVGSRADGLVAPELAASAKQVALVHPVDAAPEPGHTPSAALTDFVRCRDLTCRWPGCEDGCYTSYLCGFAVLPGFGIAGFV